LITWDADGSVALVATGDAGQVLTSNGAGAAPTFQVNAGGGGMTWSAVADDGNLSINTGTIANKGTLLTITLPTTAAVGSVIRISGMGAGGWKLAQNASEIIHFGNTDTTTGTDGYLASSHIRDAVELVCCVADTEWNVVSSIGNITIV
jgi:hypothetical protein